MILALNAVGIKWLLAFGQLKKNALNISVHRKENQNGYIFFECKLKTFCCSFPFSKNN